MRYVIIFILTLMLLRMPIFAYESVEEYITPEIAEYIPDDILGEDNFINYNNFIDSVLSCLYANIRTITANIFVILGVVILSSVISIYAHSLGTPAISKCFSYLSSVCITVMIYGILMSVWEEMSSLLNDINVFMTATTPVTTLLYAMGGNVTTATVNNTAMSLILTAFEKICYYGIRPVLQICFGFSIISVLSPNVNLKFISRFIRKSYTSILVFSISLMTGILSLQNMLTRSSDSFALKTVKFASSATVPLVGGCLSQATETVASGIKSIRTTFGVMAILAILLMVAPWMFELLLNKFSFSIAAAISRVFGLNMEADIINDAAELLNFAFAITVSCAVMFIISIAVFAESSCAIGS